MPRALVSKSARGSATLVVTATCAGEVQDGVGVGVAGEQVVHRVGVADVGLDEVGDAPVAEPGEVGVGPAAAEVVDEHDVVRPPRGTAPPRGSR